jgi:O-antigen ligase
VKSNWRNTWFDFWPAVFAFALPFGGIVLSWIIALWAINSFTLIPSRIQKGSWRSWWFLSYVGFFILTVISTFYTQNTKEGLTAIEVKLSFVLLPYLLFLFNYPKETFKLVVLSFCGGLAINLLSLIIIGSVSFISTGHFPYYMDFSYFLHPSYMSMFLCIGILFLLLMPIEHLSFFGKNHVLFWVLVFFLIIGIVLCASKIGMLIALIIVPSALLVRMRKYLNSKKAVIAISGLLVLLFFFTKLFPESLNRLRSITQVDVNHIDKSSTESTEIRLLIWRECTILWQQAGSFGFGVGDVNDKLYEQYLQHELTGAYEHKLNAHNQYFQTFLGLGYPGLIMVFFLTLGLFIFGCIKHNALMALLGIVCTLNFCVESMLQTSTGNLGFVFTTCLLMAAYEKKVLV